MRATYDSIGVGYAQVRRPDPRVARQIAASLGSARRLLNVGAGAGRTSRRITHLVALEPSQGMIQQRPPSASRLVVRGMAGELPFSDGSFDAAMALLTVHHWPDPAAGLREMRRVTTGPVVVFTFDYTVRSNAVARDRLPAVDARARHRGPAPSAITDALGGGEVRRPSRPSRLHRRLLPCMVAAARRLSRSLGARRHLGDRPYYHGRRRAGHGPSRRRPGVRRMASRACRLARPH